MYYEGISELSPISKVDLGNNKLGIKLGIIIIDIFSVINQYIPTEIKVRIIQILDHAKNHAGIISGVPIILK